MNSKPLADTGPFVASMLEKIDSNVNSHNIQETMQSQGRKLADLPSLVANMLKEIGPKEDIDKEKVKTEEMDTNTPIWLTIDGLSMWFNLVHLAVSMGDLKRVKQLIKKGVNINEVQFGYTPLEIALIRGMDEISLLLLGTEGIDVNSRKGQKPLLILAVERSSIEVLTKLINYPLHQILPDEFLLRKFIEYVCKIGRVDVLELLRSTRFPQDVDKHISQFHRREPCPFTHIPITNFLLQNGFYNISNSKELAVFLCHANMNSNSLKLLFHNWGKFCPSIDMDSSDGQKVLFVVLKEAMIENDKSKIIEILQHVTLATIREEFQNISPHEFCVLKEGALLQFLDALSATTDPFLMLGINEVLQHCISCIWSKPSSVIRKIYSIWNKTFTLYRGCLYLWIFCAQGLSHIAFCERAIQYAWDGLHDTVLIRLYNMIKYEMLDAFRENVNLIRYVESNLLEQTIEGKRISLIEYACQSMDAVHVLEKRTNMCFRKSSKLAEYFEWYEGEKWKKAKVKTNSIICFMEYKRKQEEDKLTFVRELTSTAFENVKVKIDKYDFVREKQMLVSCLKQLFDCMLGTIARENPLFKCSSKIVGSFREGTRPFKPDEYDLLLVLDELVKYVEIKEMGEYFAYAVYMNLRNEFIGDKLFEGITDANGQFTADLKIRLDKLVQRSLSGIFKHGTYGEHLILEPNYGQFGSISNIQLIWRGKTFKDMKIFVDLVPVLPFTEFKSQYREDYRGKTLHVFLKPTKMSYDELGVRDESRVEFENRFRFEPLFQIAYSDYEIKSIGELPPSLKTGYRMAKAIRIMPLFPDFVLNQLQHVDNIEDYLPTYMLKTAVLFIAKIAKLKIIAKLEPDQWAYLIYVHVRERLLDGLITLCWDIRPRWVTHHTEACFQCNDPLDIEPSEMRTCCIRRQNLLIIATWLRDLLKANLKTPICKDIEEDVKDLRRESGKFIDMIFSDSVKK